MSIQNYALSQDSVKMEILSPLDEVITNEDGTKPLLLIQGTHTSEYQKLDKKLREQEVKAAQRNKLLSPTVRDDHALQRIMCCVVGWENFGWGEKDGKTDYPKFSEELFKEILTKPEFAWLIGRITEFLTNNENFISKS